MHNKWLKTSSALSRLRVLAICYIQMNLLSIIFLLFISFGARAMSFPCGEPNQEMQEKLGNQIEFELLDSDDKYEYVRARFPTHPDMGKIDSAGIGVFHSETDDKVMLATAEAVVNSENGVAVIHFMAAKDSKVKINVWGEYDGPCSFSIRRYFEYNKQIQRTPNLTR